MLKVRVNGIELYYEVHGQGYRVVFRHGFAGTVNMWQPQVPVLSREHQLIWDFSFQLAMSLYSSS